MKDSMRGMADTRDTTPLESYLTYKLSGINLASGASAKPVCSTCNSLGESKERLVLDEQDSVYVCASWKECVGWELFGIYHSDHDVVEIADSNPPRPVALLEGHIEKTERTIYDESAPEAYALADLSLLTVNYPGSLDY